MKESENTDTVVQETKQAGTVIKLSRPFTWEGVEYKELDLNFERLTGDEIVSLESDFLALNEGKNFIPYMKSEHPAYQAVLAAKALGVHYNCMKKLPAKDFNRVTKAARDFLRDWD
ncbi:phage tail assembly protein [Paenibacillus brevis]|uniref:Phage tail assembly protein n=1 Tax=Paenibacillus brevis TaxID=2841508 RepID=A0ABS6FU23_9BACL|nr:phage tail assembly protein [Paenibacillus brevis]MBU5672646.1 phage tail assembly protein [Paenibacillus brevis]